MILESNPNNRFVDKITYLILDTFKTATTSGIVMDF
jgi:hypothetical protein